MDCMKNHKLMPNGECCCNCNWHIKDLSHPGTNGKSVSEQRGWICASPEFDGMFSGWGEHGLCELWTPETKGKNQ